MLKKFIIFLLLCSMALTMAACGTDTKTEGGQKTDNGIIQSDNEDNAKELSMEALRNAADTPEENFDYLIYDGVVYLSGYFGTSGIVVIPDEIEGCPVVEISDGAFRNNENIKAVKIGSNVKTIGDSAFINCTGLEYVLFGDSVEEVGDYAFAGNPNVKEFSLNEGLLSVGTTAICEAEVPVLIPESVKEIGDNAFRQPVQVYAGSYAEEYIVDYANNYSGEFVYEIIE